MQTHGNQNINNVESYNVTESLTYNIPLPKCKRTATKTPMTICTAKTIGAVTSHKILRVLFDSESTKTRTKQSALPCTAKPKQLGTARNLLTLAGKLTAADVITLRDIRLPEFDKNRQIDEHKALVFYTKSRYDIILGTDFFSKSWYRH